MIEQEFVAFDRGDPSAGISGFTERVRLQFPTRTESLGSDELDVLCECLGSFYDAAVVTLERWTADNGMTAEAEEEQYRDWAVDQLYAELGMTPEAHRLARTLFQRGGTPIGIEQPAERQKEEDHVDERTG